MKEGKARIDSDRGSNQDAAAKATVAGPPLAPGAAFIRALVGGFAAAVAGGIVWGAVVVKTGHEIALVAWAIGLIAGLAVLAATRRARGATLQIVAVMAAVAGISLAKYVAFASVFEKLVSAGQIPGIKQASIFSVTTVLAFIINLPQLVNGYDLLWAILALVTAWQMLADKPKTIPEKLMAGREVR